MTSSDCLKASLHQSPHTRHLLCFGISISSHPMGYVLNHLEVSELALRDSVAKCRTVKKKNFPCRGKSLARKDFFWPLGESHHFCLSGKDCAFLRSCQLLLLKSCLLQGPCVYGFPYCPKLLAVPGMPASPSRSPNLAQTPTFGTGLRATCDSLWTFKGQNKRNFTSLLERPWRTLSHRQKDSTQSDKRLQ